MGGVKLKIHRNIESTFTYIRITMSHYKVLAIQSIPDTTRASEASVHIPEVLAQSGHLSIVWYASDVDIIYNVGT